MWRRLAALHQLVVLLRRALVSSGISTEHPEDIVHVLAGTDTISMSANSNGNTLPQIKMPWGFNDWAPQTDGVNGAWWFQRGSNSFEGLRCTHQPSPWIGDYGHFLLQPHTEESAITLKWSPETSIFRPYLFQSTLEGIKFQFTPTSHAAMIRLHFPKKAPFARLSLIIGDGNMRVDDGTTIRGVTTAHSDNKGVPDDWTGMFFTVKALSGTRTSEGRLLGHTHERAILDFETGKGPVLIAVGTSFISEAQADLNLQQELGSKSFEDVMAEGKAKWAQQLGRVRIDAIDENQLAVFYTNLWKAMLFPRNLGEVDAWGKEVHRSPYTGEVKRGKLVADSGFWDSYRTVYQLQSLLAPDNLGGLIDGWVDAYREARWLPQWPSPGQVEHGMVGTMGDVTLADAIVKSKWGLVSGFDVDLAYDAIRKDAFHQPEGHFGRSALQDYIDKGYVPSPDTNSVSKTLNYYESDAAIARAARILGKAADDKALCERSKRYGILFNPKTGFFQPKDENGEFAENWSPLVWGSGFTEAGAWQYRFYVPHDVEGLNKLYNGKICEAIQNMMSQTQEPAYLLGGSYGGEIHEQRELAAIQTEFGQYAHGNQPVHHILYVAKKAGCNSVADKYLRRVMRKLYTKRGWAGDEDNGEMASWYILSSLGVYQLEGAKDELVLGSPAVRNATVKLPGNKFFTVDTINQGVSHVYVQSARWTPAGGHQRPINDNVMKFTELMQGGTLTFEMGPFPRNSLRQVGVDRQGALPKHGLSLRGANRHEANPN